MAGAGASMRGSLDVLNLFVEWMHECLGVSGSLAGFSWFGYTLGYTEKQGVYSVKTLTAPQMPQKVLYRTFQLDLAVWSDFRLFIFDENWVTRTRVYPGVGVG